LTRRLAGGEFPGCGVIRRILDGIFSTRAQILRAAEAHEISGEPTLGLVPQARGGPRLRQIGRVLFKRRREIM
jgi:hypothetical protein